MPIYRYQHESLVDTVHLLQNDKGGLRAYLYADNGKDTEKLRLLKQTLRAKGYECVPVLYKDQPVLEVRGYKTNDELMGYLGELHALKGKPEVTAAEGDVRTTKQKFASATLKMAGLSFNIGDVAYMSYVTGPVLKTIHENHNAKALFPKTKLLKGVGFAEYLDILAGIGYAIGSTCLTVFGSKDQSINTIKETTSKIERFSRTEGYNIAPESSIAFVNHKHHRDLWGSIKETVGRYPSESLNSIYVGVGTVLAGAALHRATKVIDEKTIAKAKEEFVAGIEKLERKPVKVPTASKDITSDMVRKNLISERTSDRVDVGLGFVTAASAITGLAVKEQKHLEGDSKRHGIGGVIDWVKEKPLRATGYGYLLATAFHAVATKIKWDNRGVTGKGKGFLAYRGVFIATNVLSELLMAVSSKGHGAGVKPDSSIDESIISTAAELVLRQPENTRDAIISQLSGYIASPEVLAVKADKVETSLREHLKKLDQNPWTKHYVQTATGEMVEMAPKQEQALVSTAMASKDNDKPTNVVSNTEHVARQHALEHAVA